MTLCKGSFIVAVMLLLPGTVSGQRAASVFPSTQASPSGGTRAFLIETGGATAGSLIGFGLVYLSRNSCDTEDLGCNLERAGLGILTSTIGATAGTVIVGKMANTEPSTLGAALGAIAGAGAGIGLWHLFTEELNVINGPTAAILTYSITQGILTAAGSRMVSALR